MMARQKGAKKRSLQVVNEHFEPIFNAASAALGINQSYLKMLTLSMKKPMEKTKRRGFTEHGSYAEISMRNARIT